MGQRAGLRRPFIIFWPNSIVLASEMAFLKNVHFGARCFLSLEFRFMQVCTAFWLEIGQWAINLRSFIVFRSIPSFWPPKWYFCKNFHFDSSFICATFRLKMGQRAGLCRRFIVFRLNSIILSFEMAFFRKFSFQF